MRRRGNHRGDRGRGARAAARRRAQRSAMPVIGFLGAADPAGYAILIEALRLGLRDHGYVEGRNIAIEYRWAEEQIRPSRTCSGAGPAQGRPHRNPRHACLPRGKQATTAIPIVMAIVGNPVDTGIVAALARPGGNVTELIVLLRRRAERQTAGTHEGDHSKTAPGRHPRESRQSANDAGPACHEGDGTGDRSAGAANRHGAAPG